MKNVIKTSRGGFLGKFKSKNSSEIDKLKIEREKKLKEQKLTPFVRDGFTAVEWGGVTY